MTQHLTAIAGYSPQHNRTQGWSTTAALVIIARKIARAAWCIHHYYSISTRIGLQKILDADHKISMQTASW
jgi:hypothetical protein